MQLHAKAKTLLLYRRFSSKKQAILSSYNKYNKYASIYKVIIFFFL